MSHTVTKGEGWLLTITLERIAEISLVLLGRFLLGVETSFAISTGSRHGTTSILIELVTLSTLITFRGIGITTGGSCRSNKIDWKGMTLLFQFPFFSEYCYIIYTRPTLTQKPPLLWVHIFEGNAHVPSPSTQKHPRD